MPRKTAGRRYPHATTDARVHDHGMCEVIGAIAARAENGAEEWGTVHYLPALADPGAAHGARNRLFNARSCKRLARTHGELSVSVTYRMPDGTLTNTRTAAAEGYVLAVRVWQRDAARREIIGRVEHGDHLAYNAWRG